VLGEITAVLPGDAGDQCLLRQWFFSNILLIVVKHKVLWGENQRRNLPEKFAVRPPPRLQGSKEEAP
jgi:hypothetical protein